MLSLIISFAWLSDTDQILERKSGETPWTLSNSMAETSEWKTDSRSSKVVVNKGQGLSLTVTEPIAAAILPRRASADKRLANAFVS